MRGILPVAGVGQLLPPALRVSALLVRAPNHLGDLLMALPAIRSLQPADVLAPR